MISALNLSPSDLSAIKGSRIKASAVSRLLFPSDCYWPINPRVRDVICTFFTYRTYAVWVRKYWQHAERTKNTPSSRKKPKKVRNFPGMLTTTTTTIGHCFPSQRVNKRWFMWATHKLTRKTTPSKNSLGEDEKNSSWSCRKSTTAKSLRRPQRRARWLNSVVPTWLWTKTLKYICQRHFWPGRVYARP